MESISSQPHKNFSDMISDWLKTAVGRIIASICALLVMVIVLYGGFIFLRDTDLPQPLMIIIAILWGVGGAALDYYLTNFVVEMLPGEWPRRLQPFVFVGPAVFLMAWALAIPTVRTLALSFFDANSINFVGFRNYVFAFTDRIMLEAFRNNLLWLVVGTSFCVSFGLLIAVLANRTRLESLYKSLIFMPQAISFVGAGVIWKFIYAYRGSGTGLPEIGLLNAIVVALGGTAQPWLQLFPWNNLFLIVIFIWMQTGYAMVILSSAIKDVPAELEEAARIDGATEVQVFFHIVIPYIQGTLITVSTTIVIFSLKLFDIVRVMTGGNYGTNVIANEFYLERFTYGQAGRASAIAIVLLILVIPVIVYNLRQFRESKAF
ncbi:MAG TPA: sugar ABC transporter permease [Anaerolineaceae bacterium]|nr:sugar ABC transporter permease [Anaerolineaceae bacterium]